MTVTAASRALIRHANRVLPGLDRTAADLAADPALTDGPLGTAAIEAGLRALRKVAHAGVNADLAADEQAGLEAIVVTVGRPAILIQEDRFFPPPSSWQILEEHRAAIERTCRSVGRIEVTGHPALDWIGTGFLVATDLVLTNKHVVREFLDWDSRDGWAIDPQMQVRVDFAEEIGTDLVREHQVTAIAGIHPALDVALLRIGPDDDTTGSTPPPLPLARTTRALRPGAKVYVVGYPAADSRRNDTAAVTRIFGDIFNVKRLQPGEIRTVRATEHTFSHDCSTLGGNSGSCVVDLETNQVLGAHFRGRYLDANWAVSLPYLVDAILDVART